MDQNLLDQIFRSSLTDHKTSLDKDLLWDAINEKQSRRRYMAFFKILGVCILLVGAAATILYLPDNADTAEPLNFTSSSKNATINNESTKTNTATRLAESKKVTAPVLVQEAKTLQSNETEPAISNTTSSIPHGSTAAVAQAFTQKTAAPLTTKDFPPLSSHSESTFLLNDKVECYDHRSKLAPFYVEFYGTVDFVKNRLSAGPGEEIDYLEERKATQTQLEGYRTGVRFKYLFRSGLYLKSGAELGLARERFDRSITEQRTEIWPNQLLETITQSDTTIFIYGDKPVDIIETTTWKVWNTYRTIGIPILAGFQRSIGKLSYGVELGAIYNLQHRFKGMLLDNNLQPSMVTNYFKSRINTSLTGGLHIGYNLNDKYRLRAYSSFKHNLSKINSTTNPIYQSYSKLGLGMALEIKI